MKSKKRLMGSTLKLIAVASMLLDHIGAVILERALIQMGMGAVMAFGTQEEIWAFHTAHAGILATYYIFRYVIGRVAFPIYCFLLVEGFLHTRSVRKYGLRLGLFALISEIPFDLAFNGKAWDMQYQNVFFTLFIGLCVMAGFSYAERIFHAQKFKKILCFCVDVLLLAAGALAAEALKTDYGAIGVLCIMALYIFRRVKWQQILAGCLAFLWEGTALLAFIPISLYNGERGRGGKYFFYAFYPIHLLVLFLIALACGLI